MIKSSVAVALMAAVVGISGCATRAETIGTGAGMAAGAAVGGGTLGTVGGAMVGYAAGRAYDQRHN
ncbi:MAG TPA: hypothetical protein VN675_14595 [Burkholderiales bacterium]|nr:hypothetical protein [Burkholderiales bacterium]